MQEVMYVKMPACIAWKSVVCCKLQYLMFVPKHKIGQRRVSWQTARDIQNKDDLVTKFIIIFDVPTSLVCKNERSQVGRCK